MAGALTSLLLTTSLIVYTALAATTLDEEQVAIHVTRGHPMVRPVEDTKSAVTVSFGMSLLGIELDENAEILRSHGWLYYGWTDPFLAWNASEFNGVQSISVPPSSIWIPDIEPYNAKGPQQLSKSLAVVFHEGAVSWVPTTHLGTQCSIDLTYFPFDTQHCVIKFGSWTYDGSKVNLTLRNDKLDVTDYSPSKAWDVVGNKAHRNVKVYNCCPEPYIDVTFTVSLTRRSSFFMYIYVSPAIILSLLGSAIFVLPPGSAQKTILGGALLICYGLFFVEIAEVLPPVHTGTPLIDRYYTAIYAMLAVSVFLSAIITSLTRCSSPPPDPVNKVVVGCLGRLLCMSSNRYTDLLHGDDIEITEANGESAGKGNRKCGEWLLVSAVLDRFFLLCYLVLTFIITFSILIQYA